MGSDLDGLGINWKRLLKKDSKRQTIAQKQLKYLEKSGEALEDIKFLNCLGEGGFGKVWLVTAKRYDRKRKNVKHLVMACKVIQLKPSSDGKRSLVETVDTLLTDVTTLRYLKHKNIVTFEDMITIPDEKTGFPFSTILMFMEYMSGDMIKLLESNPPNYCLSEDLCKYWFAQIANALHYLHRNSVVHLDIKPDNILYKNKTHRRVQRLDFDVKHDFQIG